MVGYRNIAYSPATRSVKLFTWDEKGNRISETHPFEPYLFVESENGDEESIFKTKLRKRTFQTQFDRNKFIQSCGTTRLFDNIRPDQQFLIDKYYKNNSDSDFSKFDIRVVTIDIEVYAPDTFPLAEEAKFPINIITIHDSLTKKFFSWGTGPYKHDRENLEYFECKNERELLLEFKSFFSDLECDLLTGWNSSGFDIPYIINRMGNVLGADHAKDLSPIKRVYPRTMSGMFGKQETRWYIDGISCVDYIDIYKRFRFKNRDNYKLDNIAEIELGEKKVDYGNTNLASLAKNDWNLFVDYNIQDVALLAKLDEKLKYINLLRMLAYMGLTTMENAMSTLSTITGTSCIKARNRNQHLPTFIRNEVEGKNPGAYVAEPLEGFQQDVVSFDANSLYPNIMISLNMSPETKIGKIIDNDEEKITIQHINGTTYDLTPSKFIQFLNTESISVSKAKILFSQKHKGILPEIVDECYKERVTIQKELHELEKELAEKEKNIQPEKEKKLKYRITQLNAKQLCIKIFINSVYGYMGNKHAPLGDDDIASSITLTGQYIIKSARKIAQKYVDDVCGKKMPDIAVAGDTDSLYISIKPVLDKLNTTLMENSAVTSTTYGVIDEINKHINTEVEKIMRRDLNSLDPRIFFKRESIIDKGLFLEKKRYVAHVVDEKGIVMDKWKYVGVEVVRTAMPKQIKPHVKNIIETMLSTQSRTKTNAILNYVYDEFKKLKPEDLCFVVGVRGIEKYKDRFSNFNAPKGTPIHVKSAINYNILLKRLNIADKYEEIQSGDKIRWMYISTPNKFGISTIAYKYYYPREFVELFKPNYELMFEKMIFSVVERFYNAVKWPAHKPTEQPVSDLFDLFG